MKPILGFVLFSLMTTTVFAQSAISTEDVANLEKKREKNPSYYVDTPLAYAYLASRKFEKVIQLLGNLEDQRYREIYLKPFINPNYYTTLDLYLGIAYSETGNTVLAKHYLKSAKKWILGGVCKGKMGPCYSKEKMSVVEAYYNKSSSKNDPNLFSKAIAIFPPYAGVQ